MNKTALSIVSVCCALFVIAVLSSSCKKAFDEPGYNGFRVAFGNQEYIADTAYYFYEGKSTIIEAYKNGVMNFYIYMKKADTTGTYTLDTINNTAYYFSGPQGAIGTLTLQSISGTLQYQEFYNDSLATCYGNFSFFGRQPGSGGNTLNFTYGYFNDLPRH